MSSRLEMTIREALDARTRLTKGLIYGVGLYSPQAPYVNGKVLAIVDSSLELNEERLIAKRKRKRAQINEGS